MRIEGAKSDLSQSAQQFILYGDNTKAMYYAQLNLTFLDDSMNWAKFHSVSIV